MFFIQKKYSEEVEKNNKHIVSTNRELKKQNDSWTKKMQELKDDNQNKLVEKDEIIKAIEVHGFLCLNILLAELLTQLLQLVHV